MARRINLFKDESLVDVEFEKSLAEMVKTIEVNQVELRPDTEPQKPVKTRRSMSISDWDDCLS